MAELPNAAGIATQYHKIAHLLRITYHILSAREKVPDQVLLELELQIRADHPRILVTYYNKCLYYFEFEHDSTGSTNGNGKDENDPQKPSTESVADPSMAPHETDLMDTELFGPDFQTSTSRINPARSLDLASLYPQLLLLKKHTVGAEQLANPSKALKNTTASRKEVPPEADEHLPFVSLSFLKAVKKTVVYSMCVLGQMQPFGNYIVSQVPDTSAQLRVIQCDPVLLTNGDLIVSLTQRNQLALFGLSIVDLEPSFSQLASSFAIYVVPSGLRCHLYDTSAYSQSFTYTPPKTSANLLRLLHLSTGVDLTQKQNILWVKLLPNLQHLNNHILPISAFLHDVENKKFILWPWELCVLQFGSVETSNKPSLGAADDPLSLISDFLQYSINAHRVHLPIKGANDMLTMDLLPPPTLVNDQESLPKIESVPGTLEMLPEKSPQVSEEGDEEEENDDLFGDESDTEMKDAGPRQSVEPEKDPLIPDSGDLNHINHELDTEVKMVDSTEANAESHITREFEKKHAKYVSIPREEMISHVANSPIMSYNDPGAPPPIAPTPNLVSHAQFQPTPSKPLVETYSFSPIAFNPKIKSSIDTKYGRGGKFFVDREELAATDTEPRETRLRETSVVPIDPNVSLDNLDFGKWVEIQADDTMRINGDPPLNPDMMMLDANRGNNNHAEGSEDGSSDSEEADDDGDNQDEDGEDEEVDDEENFDADEDEESDEDEDGESHSSVFKNSPLKLNTQVEDIFNTAGSVANHSTSINDPTLAKVMSSFKSNHFKPKPESPFGYSGPLSTEGQGEIFYPTMESQDESLKTLEKPEKLERLEMALESSTPQSSGSQSIVSESLNCLPLILRSITVYSIPNTFLIKGLPSAWAPLEMGNVFDIDADEDDDELEERNNLVVGHKNLDMLLQWIVPHLVFDQGINVFDSRTQLRLPDAVGEKPLLDITDSEASDYVASQFALAFPLSYRINLKEFMRERKAKVESDLLTFMEEIVENASPSPADFSEIYWDSLSIERESNWDSFKKYTASINNDYDDKGDQMFFMTEPKVKVLKTGSEVLNLNYSGINFWKYLAFSPVNGPKQFQVLLISENSATFDNTSIYDTPNLGFLDLLRSNYGESNLGAIKKLHMPKREGSPDLDGINNGILLVGRGQDYRMFYKHLNRRLKSLAEMIRLDLINKTNRFDFDRPLLLLFVNFDLSPGAVVQISKVCRNFRATLDTHHLSLVEFFSHVIPGNSIVKQAGEKRRLRYLSGILLTNLSTLLYNRCPNIAHKVKAKQPRSLYVPLVKEPPSKLSFKFLNKFKDGLNTAFDDDLFLHVAYERSIDKRWLSAAWLDPLGLVTDCKAWRCERPDDLGHVITDIWEISNRLLKQLNEALALKSCGSGKKRFLVLARISSIIPDDELVFWKKLTAKYKDVSLIVLLTNRLPKYLFWLAEGGQGKPSSTKSEAYLSPISSTGPSNALLMGLPINASFHSPQQFLNAPTSYLTPLEELEEAQIRSSNHDVVGVIPKTSLPSFNSPTRLGMRIGYLMKKVDSKYMVLEVTLLSCSAFWNLNAIMKIILNQYSKLIVLNEIMGVCPKKPELLLDELRALAPWHVNAVVKSIDYLVHIGILEGN